MEYIYILGRRVYVALCLEDPRNTGTGNTIKEPHGGGYERVKTDKSFWGKGLNGFTANVRPIVFPEATQSWGLIVSFAILDAKTGGNMAAWGKLPKPHTINKKDTVQFPVGTLGIR